jgi:hypothetical protein
LQERLHPLPIFWIIFGKVREHADAPHPLALLRPRRERPSCRTTEKRDELASL